jgi:hypothetical protein
MTLRTMAAAALWGVLFSSAALAAQSGVVISESAEVHQAPTSSSPQTATLNRGISIRLSSDLTRDAHGEYWYKVRMPLGDLGYIRAKDVEPANIDRDLKAARVTRVQGHRDDQEPVQLPRLWEIRAMGSAGYEINSASFEAGGEGEFSTSVYSTEQGFCKILAGAAVQGFSTEIGVLGSLIWRFYTEGVLEPEFRIRAGYGATSGSVLAGANIGVRYPFSLDSSPRLSGYLETGGLGSFAASAPVHFFGSAGIGLQF